MSEDRFKPGTPAVFVPGDKEQEGKWFSFSDHTQARYVILKVGKKWFVVANTELQEEPFTIWNTLPGCYWTSPPKRKIIRAPAYIKRKGGVPIITPELYTSVEEARLIWGDRHEIEWPAKGYPVRGEEE